MRILVPQPSLLQIRARFRLHSEACNRNPPDSLADDRPTVTAFEGATISARWVLVADIGHESNNTILNRARRTASSLFVEHRQRSLAIATILKEHGIDPAPERGSRTRWSTFLKAHWESLAATDFFTLEVCTLRGFVTYYVLFFVDLPTRSVHIAGITRNPDELWMMQTARTLTVFAHFFEGRERGLARTAFGHEVPAPILQRQWKDRAPGVFEELVFRNRKFLREMLPGGALCSHKLLDAGAIESVLSDDFNTKPFFVNELMKHLILEIWVRHFVASPIQKLVASKETDSLSRPKKEP